MSRVKSAREWQRTITIAALSFGALLSACNTDQAEPPPPPIRPVRYVESYALGGARLRTFAGVAKASTQTRLSFKVAGTLSRLTPRVGDTVRQGQVFAIIDPTDYELQVERAAAGLAQGRAQLVNAESDFARVRGLYERDNASQGDYDAALARAESARANLRSLEKQLEQARLQVSYCQLSSPVTGGVVEVPVEVNENVRSGQTIVTINDAGIPEVEVAIPEVLIGEMRSAVVVESVTFTAMPEKAFHGRITEVAVAATQGLTTFPVTVELSSFDARILPGMAAEVVFGFRATSALARHVLPPQAVGQDREGRFVYVVRAQSDGVGVVERRPVTIGGLIPSEKFGSALEVLEGLADGDKVVTAGVSKIADGQQVRLAAEWKG